MSLEQTIAVPGLTESEQDALTALVKQWRAKRTRNNLRTAFYDMKNSHAPLMSAQVPAVVRRRSFVLGWSALAVDKLNRRCNLEGFFDEKGRNLDRLGLDQIVEDNRLLMELGQGVHASLLHGPSFVVTTQGDTQSGEPPVLVHARSAEVSTAVWDVRRREVSSFLSITDLGDDGEPTGMAMYLPGLNVIMEKSQGVWSIDRRRHRWGVPVDILRYRQRLGREFGASRINRTVMSLHTQALSAMIRADVNGEGYSLARYVLLGATEEAFKNADGTPKAAWQSAWDAVWAIGDDPDADPGLERAEVKQFSGQSPEPQNAHLRMLAQMFSGETGIPLGELGLIGDANPTSAESLVVSRDDLVAESLQAQREWNPDIARVPRRALEMLTGRELPRLRVRPVWADPINASPAAKADSGQKILSAQPWLGETSVGLELLGLTPEQAKRAVAERQQQQAGAAPTE